jgi:hypothetical protein
MLSFKKLMEVQYSPVENLDGLLMPMISTVRSVYIIDPLMCILGDLA